MSDQLLLALKVGFVVPALPVRVAGAAHPGARSASGARNRLGDRDHGVPPRRRREMPLGPRLVVLSSPVYPPGTLVRLDADVAFGRAAENDVVLEGRSVRVQPAQRRARARRRARRARLWAPPTAPSSAGRHWPASTCCAPATSCASARPSCGTRSSVRVVDYAIATHAGRVRRKNEDAYYAEPPLFAVADGMGGALAGELASRIAVQALGELVEEGSAEERLASIGTPGQPARGRARDVRSRASGMGSTVTAALVEPGLGGLRPRRRLAGLPVAGRRADAPLRRSFAGRRVGQGGRAGSRGGRAPPAALRDHARAGADWQVDVDTWTTPARRAT